MRERSYPLDNARQMCDTTATDATDAPARSDGWSAQSMGGRLTTVSDKPTGLVSPLRVVPEQLKSGKQNKQQLLLG